MRFAKKVRLFVPMFLGTLTLVWFGLAAVADEKQETKEPSKKEQAANPDISAMKAAKDADGSLRQTTTEEEKALAAKIKNTLSKYPKHVIKTHPNGAKSLVSAPYNIALSVATIDRDGKIQYNCSNANGIDKKVQNKQPETAEE